MSYIQTIRMLIGNEMLMTEAYQNKGEKIASRWNIIGKRLNK
ncbi:hypothetical protein ACIQGW_16475 [Lysinibacillus xylanilyticus]